MKKEISIELRPAPDDGPLSSVEYQQALHEFQKTLRAGGLNPSVGLRFMDAAAGPETAAIYNGAYGLALAALPVIGGFLGVWLKGKYGRTVELEVGGVKAKAATVEELREVLKIAQEFQDRNEPKRIVP